MTIPFDFKSRFFFNQWLNPKAFLIILGLLGIVFSGKAFAIGTDDDFQNWSVVTYTGEVKRLQLYGETQSRVVLAGPVGPHMQYLLVRGYLGYRVNKHLSVAQGMAWVQSFQPQLWTESRPFQQVLLEGKLKRLKITNRFRVEERFIRGVNGVGIRLRDEVRLIYPLGKSDKWSLVAFDEVFCNMNNFSGASSEYTRYPQRGIDQNRLFVGVSRKLNNHMAATAGYMLRNNNIENSGIPVARNHILLLTLAFTK